MTTADKKPGIDKPEFDGEWVRLGDVATYVNGYAFKPTDYCADGLPIIRIQNLTGNAYETNRFDGALSDKYRVENGDILISWSASLGVYRWNRGEAWLNQHIFKVVFDKLPVNLDFFVYQAGYLIENSTSLAHGATMRHLTKKVSDSRPFFYPPSDVQAKIARTLMSVDAILAYLHLQVSKLDDLVKSRFVEMFGDPNKTQCTTTLEDAFFIRDDLRKPLSGKERESMKEGALYPYYGANGVVDWINQYLIDTDALCFAEDCGSYGPDEPTAYIIREKAWVNNHAHLLLPRVPYFLEYACSCFRLLDVSRFISGTTRSKMTQAQLKQIRIGIPESARLKEFADFVAKVDKLGFAA